MNAHEGIGGADREAPVLAGLRDTHAIAVRLAERAATLQARLTPVLQHGPEDGGAVLRDRLRAGEDLAPPRIDRVARPSVHAALLQIQESLRQTDARLDQILGRLEI